MALQKRSDKARAYFDELAGKFGKTYCPGRSWKALAESLLKLMPPMVIADMGAGEGTFSQLLAQRAEKVIAVDNSEKMVDSEPTWQRKTVTPIWNTDLEVSRILRSSQPRWISAFFSQALHHAEKPDIAIAEAHRILKPGGRIVVLDLLKQSV